MWVFSGSGFYSVVEHKKRRGYVLIRARVRNDLKRLRKYVNRSLKIQRDRTGTFDYPYRSELPKADFASAMYRMVADIDYTNFKDSLESRATDTRKFAYMRIWALMRTTFLRIFPSRLENPYVPIDESAQVCDFLDPDYAEIHRISEWDGLKFHKYEGV